MASQTNENLNGNENNPTDSKVPKWLTAELFENLFKEIVVGYKQIKTFKAVPGTVAGENYATIMLRLHFDVELQDGTSKPLSLMIKLSHDSELYLELLKKNNLFETEVEMYCDIVPELEQLYRDVGVEINFGAKCYKINAHNNNYVLLEDLGTQGFKNTNRLEGLDIEHTQCALRVLAQWHAASAVRVATKGNYAQKYIEGFYKEDNRALMEEMFKGFQKYFNEAVLNYDNHELYVEDVLALQPKLTDLVLHTAKLNPNEFNALNHGDYWSNNIMFQYDNTGKIKQTYAVDYQIPRYGSVASDLLYFLLSSTKYEHKLSKFDYYIKYYHDILIEHLKLLNYSKPLPKLKEIHASLFRHGIWGYCTVTGVMGAVLLDPSENSSFENFLGESSEGIVFKRLMYSNARYRKHIEAILPWLQNRGALEA